MATPRAGDEAVLEGIPRDKRVGLGAVDQKLVRVETIDEVVSRLEPRLQRFGEDRLLLVPDCGFATFSDNPSCSDANGRRPEQARALRVLSAAWTVRSRGIAIRSARQHVPVNNLRRSRIAAEDRPTDESKLFSQVI
jgi:hypothetical protein